MAKERPASAGQIARARTRIADVVGAGQLVRGIAATAWSAITGKPSVNTTAPLTGGGSLASSLTLAVSTMTGDSGSGGARGVVPAPAAGDAAAGKFLKASGAWVVPTASVADGDKGDIVVTGSGATWTIDNNVVSLAKMATVATQTFLGRTTAGTGNVEALTATQATAMLDVGTSSLKGALKLGASGGALEYDATTAYTRTLLDDADAATARTTLGVTQPSTTAYTSPGTTSAVAAPSWATLCYFRIVGGGGGGGSGRRGAASSLRAGAGGGAGAGYIEGWVHVSQLSGGTVDVIVGAGGSGGAPVTTNSTDGADGTAGGASYLQTGGTTIAYAPGGPGGAKGTSSGGATGGTAVTATAQWPGGNGGGVGAAGPASVGGPGGGGGGASITASNTYTNTNGAGGAGATSRTGSATGIGGGDTQGAGATGTTPALPSTYQPGSGGAGGAAGNTAASVAAGGGGSGRYGGGGGGGGGSTNSQNSGAGGAGGDGFVILTWV